MSMLDKNLPPVGLAAQLIARETTITATVAAYGADALPMETVEGLLLAAENFLLVQIAIGKIDKDGAEAVRNKLADWGKKMAEEMESNGVADDIRKNYAEAVDAITKKGGSQGLTN